MLQKLLRHVSEDVYASVMNAYPIGKMVYSLFWFWNEVSIAVNCFAV